MDLWRWLMRGLWGLVDMMERHAQDCKPDDDLRAQASAMIEKLKTIFHDSGPSRKGA